MVCTSALTSRHPALNNPTIVVITDRNDLDDQLFVDLPGQPDPPRSDPIQSTPAKSSA